MKWTKFSWKCSPLFACARKVWCHYSKHDSVVVWDSKDGVRPAINQEQFQGYVVGFPCDQTWAFLHKDWKPDGAEVLVTITPKNAKIYSTMMKAIKFANKTHDPTMHASYVWVEGIRDLDHFQALPDTW